MAPETLGSESKMISHAPRRPPYIETMQPIQQPAGCGRAQKRGVSKQFGNVLTNLSARRLPSPLREARRAFTATLTLSMLWFASPSSAGEPLQAQFFGVSTISVSDGEQTVMTDGFFSRPGLLKLLFGLRPDEQRIDKALAYGRVSRLDALLVAHSHHDHAMDAGVVALKTGALVIGTKSAGNIALGSGLPAHRIKVVTGGETIDVGRFKVRVIESPHSPSPLFPGEIVEPLLSPAGVSRYKEGGNLSYLIEHPQGRVLVHASANFRLGMYAGMRADVVFLGVGLLGKQTDAFIKDYWREVVGVTGAKVVVPVHWDDFTRSLDEPLKAAGLLFDNVPRALERVKSLAASSQVEVRMLSQFESLPVSR